MIEVADIVKSYGSNRNKNQVLRGINLQIADGDFTVILGASGSGKSTFLNVISGLERPDSGSVIYDTLDITKLSDNELTKFRNCPKRAFTASAFAHYGNAFSFAPGQAYIIQGCKEISARIIVGPRDIIHHNLFHLSASVRFLSAACTNLVVHSC